MNDQDDLPPEFTDLPRERLKHGTGRYRNVILVPQPSDSPNDPLNVSIVSHKCILCRAFAHKNDSVVAPVVPKLCCQADRPISNRANLGKRK